MDKYIQQSSALFGSIKNAVLGNPVTREFSIGHQVASFGPGLLWKVFDGKKKSTGQDVAVFMFEKSLIDRYDRKDRESILQKMRNGPQQLTKLRHPRILTVQHPLEESRDSLAFATEPIFSSLSNVLGKHENLSSPPLDFKDFELYSVEKVYGLLQIAEGLSFIHNDASLIEGNLTADNIILTKGGQWKLAGFHFSRSKLDNASITEYTTTISPVARQELNYIAPEFILSQAGEYSFDLTKSDMFSFGCLINAVYNHLKTPFDASDSITAYKKCTEQLSRFGSDHLKNVPIQVRDHVSLLLNVSADVRPDARSTMAHPFFDDVAAMTLKYLDSLVQRDDITKSQFFKNLYHVLDKLPLRVLHQRVLPPLFSEFPNHMMIPFVLSNVFLIAKQSTKEQYMQLIFPHLKNIFNITKPIQVLLIFMQQMELMLKMTDETNIKTYVLPLIYRGLESPSIEIQEKGTSQDVDLKNQELVLTIIPNFVHMIDFSSLKNSIVPRLKTLVTKSRTLKIQVNALLCLGQILDNLDKFILIDEIFPALTQIPSKDPAILMAVLGIYKQALNHKNIHLEKDYLATKSIPFLLPLAVEPSLNVLQFNQYMSLLREMFDRVEQEHRTKLEQLQKMQDEQRSSIDFVKASNQNIDTSSGTESMMSKVDNLVTGTSTNSSNSKQIGSNSEFAKMFGLNDNSPTQSGNLLSTTAAIQKPTTEFDATAFDPVASSATPSQSFGVKNTLGSTPTQSIGVKSTNKIQPSSSAAANRLMNNNLNQMSSGKPTANQYGINSNMKNTTQSLPPDLSSFDSVLTPEMGQFQSRQQNVSMATMQKQSQLHSGIPSQNLHGNQQQRQQPMNLRMNTHMGGMNTPMGGGMNTLASRPMNSSIGGTINTPMGGARNTPMGGAMNTPMGGALNTSLRGHTATPMNNSINLSSMNTSLNSHTNFGVLQPSQMNSQSSPSSSSMNSSNHSLNKDLNDLLL